MRKLAVVSYTSFAQAASRRPRPIQTFILLFLMILVVFVSNGVAQDQPSPSQSHEEQVKKLEQEIELLQKRLAKADAEKKLREALAEKSDTANGVQQQIDELKKKAELAEAEKKLLEARLPTSETKPLSGELNIDDKVALESEMLSYQALGEIAADLGSQIKATGLKSILVYNGHDINALQYYSVVKSQLDQLEKGYKHLVTSASSAESVSAALLAPQAASAMLKSVADVIALFRTDTEIKGKTFTIEEAALVSKLQPHLTDVAVYYPLLYLPNMLSATDAEIAEITKAIGQVYDQKAKADEVIAAYEAKSDAEKKDARNGKYIPGLKALNEQFEKFIGELIKIDDKNGTNALTSLIRAEKLKKLAIASDCGTLYLKIVGAGGNNKITKNLFTGTKFSQSGGAIVSFILFDNRGAIKASETFYHYDGYVQFKSKDGTLVSNLRKAKKPAPSGANDVAASAANTSSDPRN